MISAFLHFLTCPVDGLGAFWTLIGPITADAWRHWRAWRGR